MLRMLRGAALRRPPVPAGRRWPARGIVRDTARDTVPALAWRARRVHGQAHDRISFDSDPAADIGFLDRRRLLTTIRGHMDKPALPGRRDQQPLVSAGQADKFEAQVEQAYHDLFALDDNVVEQTRPVLPSAVQACIGDAALVDKLADNSALWDRAVAALAAGRGLAGTSEADVRGLLECMPKKTRARHGAAIYDMATEAGVAPSVELVNLLLEGYAKAGNTVLVEALFGQLGASGLAPNADSYRCMLEVYMTTKNLKRSSHVVELMQRGGHKLTLEHYNVIMRTCLLTGHGEQLSKIFDLLKFRSLEDAPDADVYAIMIWHAGTQGEVERALDLYGELKSRVFKPLEANERVYQALAFACSQRRDFQSLSWKYVSKAIELAPANKFMFDLMLRVCGASGNANMARAVLLRMCESADTLPTSHSYQQLFRAYSRFEQEVTASPATRAVESQLDLVAPDMSMAAFQGKYRPPPLLPQARIESNALLLDESRAVLMFLHHTQPALVNSHLVNTYLQIAANFGDYPEFRRRLAAATVSPVETADGADGCTAARPIPHWFHQVPGTDVRVPAGDVEFEPAARFGRRLPRNRYVYQTALAAAFESRDLVFAYSVWEERELWKKSADYKALAPDDQRAADFAAVKTMVNILARGNRFQDALDILVATEYLPWTRDDLKTLYTKARLMDQAVVTDYIESFYSTNAHYSRRQRSEGPALGRAH
ncbi:uncharacterized protein V1510DRAFT_409206 [Dipodascopsis tothii]|uniref:uncharacterized protein n=1 Tax=Dipodascopsis tothii TaxID=44089 RepID=UPI0034CDA019